MSILITIVAIILAFLVGLIAGFAGLRGSLWDEGYIVDYDPTRPRGHGRYFIRKIEHKS